MESLLNLRFVKHLFHGLVSCSSLKNDQMDIFVKSNLPDFFLSFLSVEIWIFNFHRPKEWWSYPTNELLTKQIFITIMVTCNKWPILNSNSKYNNIITFFKAKINSWLSTLYLKASKEYSAVNIETYKLNSYI